MIGHQRIINFLRKSVKNNRLAHAYLFTGSAHLGKRTAALEFIKFFNGQDILKPNHSDLIIIEPELSQDEDSVKELKIDIGQIRELQHKISLFPYQCNYKVALIDQAEKITPAASHCLLKTLEEPPAQSIIILIANNPQALLPTIVSRCQLVKFLSVPEKELVKAFGDSVPKNKLSSQNKELLQLANGRPGSLLRYLENPELVKTEHQIINELEMLLRAGLNERYTYVEKIAKDVSLARQILNKWLFWFRDLMLIAADCDNLIIFSKALKYKNYYSLDKLRSIIKAIIRTERLLANPSINSRLALEVLMLQF